VKSSRVAICATAQADPRSMATVSIGIVTPTNRALGPVARLFIENARDVAKPLAKRK
jgi:hypothetical protein